MGLDFDVTSNDMLILSVARKRRHLSSWVESERFIEELDALVTARGIDAVLPLTEATMCRPWNAEVTWRFVEMPALAWFRKTALSLR